MTDEWTANVKAGRKRVPRSRGAVGGILLVLGGLWAAFVPFVGPYGNLAFTPDPNATWNWTAARGWLEVLPGAVAVVGGLLLLFSTNRVLASLGGWLGVAGGAWLVIAPTMAEPLGLDLGTPDPNQTTAIRVAEQLTFFFGIGAAIILVAALSLGRLSVVTVRDVQAAERRAAAEAEEEAEEARFAEEQRLFHEQRRDQAARERAEAAARDRDAAEQRARFGRADDEPTAVADYRSSDRRDERSTAVDDPADNRVTDDRGNDNPGVDNLRRDLRDDPAETSADPRAGDRTEDLTGRHSERRREADERFAAERERIAAEHRRGASGTDGDTATGDTATSTDTPTGTATPVAEPSGAAQGRPPQGDYPPFYGNRESSRE